MYKFVNDICLYIYEEKSIVWLISGVLFDPLDIMKSEFRKKKKNKKH